MTIESQPETGRNHFNLLRMIAASAVIVSHSFPLSLGKGAVEPLHDFTGLTLGTAAVHAFFAISGFFILMSFERRKSNLDFMMARAARILPALAVVALLSAFVVGPWLSSAPSYFAQAETWLYVPLTTSVIGIGGELPGLFATNPYAGVVNGALWTLIIEVTCYVGLFAAGILGLLRSARFRWLIVGYAMAFATASFTNPGNVYVSLSLPFLVGMAIYRWRTLLRGPAALALLGAALLSSLAGYQATILWSLAIGYGALWLGFAKADGLLRYNRLGDFSYGTYIYGFLVQQVLAATVVGIGPFQMIAVAIPVAWVLGMLSWQLVEKPGLALRHVRPWRSPRLRAASASEPG